MNEITIAAVSVIAGLVLASIYGAFTTFVRKRVTVRTPEATAITSLTPAVNALLDSNGPMMQGIIAILEAQKGQCNGNVDEALRVNREAKKRFDKFLVSQAKI
jgi:NhaP-type Na+/H+ or K+/H+ antiporter